MANVTIMLAVPEERLDAVYAAAAGVPAEAARAPAPQVETDWLELAPAALDEATDLEFRLLRRLAYARSQRVPLDELARDLGLPPESSLTQDFPALKAFCESDPDHRRFPVVAGGESGSAWYWMSITDAAAFEKAFYERDESTGRAPCGH
jgi:hypothetical protein